MRTPTIRLLFVCSLIAMLAVPAFADKSSGGEVELRSGTIGPERQSASGVDDESAGARRWVVRFKHPTGWHEKGLIEAAGGRVETALPGQAYLVTVPEKRSVALAQVPGVDWATPYLPQDKIAPEIASVRGTEAEETADVIVLLHLFSDASAKAVAEELAASGMIVEGARGDSGFGRVVLRMSASEVESRRDELAQRDEVFWVERRHRRTLQNDTSIWVGQSGLYAGQSTPVFDQGIFGTGQIGAVLDTGLDADMCYFRDDALGLPPTNTSGGTTVDPNQRKVLAVDFLDPAEDPSDPTHWDTQNHGTHVAGIFAGDDLANPIVHDPNDGMAPGAKLVIQDAGYAADSCGDLPGIGCPVTDLNPVFQQTYDQGARVHSNSWNDNENAQVQNNYTDASQDVDEFMWANPDFLIVFACGNRALGGTGTMGSPGTAKNGLTVCGTYKGENAEYMSDISAWGPTDDGRIKPDVVFPAASIISAGNDFNVTSENCEPRTMTGTSMAAPGAAGNALLVREYFMDGWYPSGSPTPADAFTPTAALTKAMLVNSAVPISWDAEGRPIGIPSDPQGWGRILLDNAMHFSGQSRGLWVEDYPGGFTSPADPAVTYMLEMEDTGEPLKVTLAWTDFPSTPAASVHLVNDLDLRVDGPSGAFKGNNFLHNVSVDFGDHDRLNNLEQVLIEDPAPGVYSIRISPHAIPSGPQTFALVVSGGRFTVTSGARPGYWTHAIDDSGPNGNGDGVLDPGETARIPVTLWNSGDAAATSVIGNLYSANPSQLKVFDGTSSYADMPVDGQAGSAAPHYEVTLEPSASCGQVVGTSMGIAGDGFEVGSAFAIDVGLRFENAPSTDTPLEIPKSDTAGVWSFLNVPENFPFTELDVTVNIDHADISEIKVLLLSPSNTGLFLHNQTDPGVSGLNTTYDELTQPHGPGSMEDFLGEGTAGNWRLRVIDDVGGGTPAGTLQGWTLHFKSDIPFNCNPVSCGESVPPPVGPTLMGTPTGASDVTWSWTGVGGASQYNVWRSAGDQFPVWSHAGTTGTTSLTDNGAQALPGLHFYLVRSVNSCNWESD
jgi:subtilisin-like proprotein convertase family protein